jgi:hypothetical protein
MIDIVAACITACIIICIHCVHYVRKKVLKVCVAYSDSSDTDEMHMFTSICVPHLTQPDKSVQSPRQRGPTASASTADSSNNAAPFSEDEGATVQPASQRGVRGGKSSVEATRTSFGLALLTALLIGSIIPIMWQNSHILRQYLSPTHTALALLLLFVQSIPARKDLKLLVNLVKMVILSFIYVFLSDFWIMAPTLIEYTTKRRLL